MGVHQSSLELQVETVSDAADVISGFDVLCRAFGEQTKDGIFNGLNPGWNTPAGKQKGAERMASRLDGVTLNRDGKPNTIILKATVVDSECGRRVIAGMAIWLQCSAVSGYGDMPPEDEGPAMNIAAIYPGDSTKQKFWGDVMSCMHAQRRRLVQEKATASPPAAMVLDLCAVDPKFQGKGIARKLVEWGLQEAKVRGDLEAITEASVMGRRVYLKMGFEQEGPQIDYGVDEQLMGTTLPSNIFLRTRKP